MAEGQGDNNKHRKNIISQGTLGSLGQSVKRQQNSSQMENAPKVNPFLMSQEQRQALLTRKVISTSPSSSSSPSATTTGSSSFCDLDKPHPTVSHPIESEPTENNLSLEQQNQLQEKIEESQTLFNTLVKKDPTLQDVYKLLLSPKVVSSSSSPTPVSSTATSGLTSTHVISDSELQKPSISLPLQTYKITNKIAKGIYDRTRTSEQLLDEEAKRIDVISDGKERILTSILKNPPAVRPYEDRAPLGGPLGARDWRFNEESLTFFLSTWRDIVENVELYVPAFQRFCYGITAQDMYREINRWRSMIHKVRANPDKYAVYSNQEE